MSVSVAVTAPLPGRGASSPVVFNNLIYLTAYTGYGIDGKAPGNPANLKPGVKAGLLLNSASVDAGHSSVPIGALFVIISFWVMGGAIELMADSFTVFSIGRTGHFVGTALLPLAAFARLNRIQEEAGIVDHDPDVVEPARLDLAEASLAQAMKAPLLALHPAISLAQLYRDRGQASAGLWMELVGALVILLGGAALARIDESRLRAIWPSAATIACRGSFSERLILHCR